MAIAVETIRDRKINMAAIVLPRLFSNTKEVKLKPGERLLPVSAEITADGCFADNARFQCPDGTMLQMIGFDRSNGRQFWIGRGFVIKQST